METIGKKSGESLWGGVLVLLAGLLLVDVLPNMLKSLYGAMSEPLVFSYGVFAFGAMGIILLIVAAGVIRDLPVFFETVSFGWRTREAYLSGSGKKEEKKHEKK